MSEDVLKTYAEEIVNTEALGLRKEMNDSTTVGEARSMAIRDLAAEVRTQRETIRELQARAAKLEREHPVFEAAVAWATGREPFASATLEEAVDDYRASEEAKA